MTASQMTFHPPLCAVCRRQVAWCTTRVDHATQDVVVEVRCHGSIQISRLKCTDLADGAVIAVGEAFQHETNRRLHDQDNRGD